MKPAGSLADAAPGRASRWLLGWVLGGFVIWFVALCALYALHAVGCDSGWPAARTVSLLAVLLLASVAAIAGLWLRQPWRGGEPAFARRVVSACLLAAAAASVGVLGPPLWLTPCGG